MAREGAEQKTCVLCSSFSPSLWWAPTILLSWWWMLCGGTALSRLTSLMPQMAPGSLVESANKTQTEYFNIQKVHIILIFYIFVLSGTVYDMIYRSWYYGKFYLIHQYLKPWSYHNEKEFAILESGPILIMKYKGIKAQVQININLFKSQFT